jgi:hypothetical protein
MAGENRRDEAGQRGDHEIAEAELLFRDDPAGKTAKPGSGSPAPPGAVAGETFELADSPFAEAEAEAAPAPPIPTAQRASARPREAEKTKTARGGEAYPIDPEAAVDVVWSRGAEWGPNLVILAAWISALMLIVYFLMGWHLGIAFLVLLVGAAGAILLSYPILITLERPVRITPEQAVKDYYGALSHHLPHYRRMWLLLARTGRTTSSYGSFEGFKAYWNEKLRTIKGSQAGAMTPLAVEVANYRGDKSSGKNQVDAKFTLKIYIRGRREAGPIASIPGEVSLVRGRDKMWYLESGTLPHAHHKEGQD